MQMTCYHGTDIEGLDHLQPSERGTMGSGVYFTLVADQASAYGDLVYQATVTLNKPWVISIDHESAMAERLNFDSPSVEAVMSLPGGMRLVRDAMTGDGLYGEDLQRIIRERGHDGIVATYPDGCAEVVAFFPDQIQDLQVIAQPVLDISPAW